MTPDSTEICKLRHVRDPQRALGGVGEVTAKPGTGARVDRIQPHTHQCNGEVAVADVSLDIGRERGENRVNYRKEGLWCDQEVGFPAELVGEVLEDVSAYDAGDVGEDRPSSSRLVAGMLTEGIVLGRPGVTRCWGISCPS